jgi:4,5-dihydroxyphthalate decarboxylase
MRRIGMRARAGLDLTLACGHYDRTEGLRDGSIGIEGVNLTYLDLPVEETFFRMVRFGEFDLAELSLSSYVISLDRDAPFVAVPAFPSRMFRHSGIYLNTAAGITAPADLVGRTVGLAEYQLTANVWIRGILAEHYGVPVDSVRYRTGGLHRPGRVEKLAVELPEGVRVTPIDAGQTLAEMLVSGEIDALYSPRTPEPFQAGRSAVARLFPDSGAEERRYFQQTGIFPIMHVVVLRRDLYERHRWLARSALKAFERARRQAVDGIDETAALRYLLPWLHDEVQRTRAVLGPDYWSYGLEANDAPLRTFLRYAREQGLVRTAFEPKDLFAPETLQEVVV